jgi:Short C-terminal domain
VHFAVAPVGRGASPPGSTADELHKLADLHRQGMLTNEEFETAKAQILTN